MPLFGRSRRANADADAAVRPAGDRLASYDDAWFDSYWDRIFALSGASCGAQDRLQLMIMTLKVMDDQAFDWFTQLGDADSAAAYLHLVRERVSAARRAHLDRTPSGHS